MDAYGYEEQELVGLQNLQWDVKTYPHVEDVDIHHNVTGTGCNNGNSLGRDGAQLSTSKRDIGVRGLLRGEALGLTPTGYEANLGKTKQKAQFLH